MALLIPDYPKSVAVVPISLSHDAGSVDRHLQAHAPHCRTSTSLRVMHILCIQRRFSSPRASSARCVNVDNFVQTSRTGKQKVPHVPERQLIFIQFWKHIAHE